MGAAAGWAAAVTPDDTPLNAADGVPPYWLKEASETAGDKAPDASRDKD